MRSVSMREFETPQANPWMVWAPYIFMILVFVGVFVLMQRRAQSQMGGIMSIGRSKAKTYSSERPGTPFADVAVDVMFPFVDGSIDRDDFAGMVADAYSTFDHPDVVPLVEMGEDTYLLELFHGPTLAFKDVALQLVGRLFDHELARRGERVTIVGATSGDTGSAAIEAVEAAEAGEQSRYIGSELTKSERPELTAASIVISGGIVRPGDAIRVTLPSEPHLPLEPAAAGRPLRVPWRPWRASRFHRQGSREGREGR